MAKLTRSSDLEESLKNLPQLPGIYMYRDKSDRIIYIGKARILRNRIRSYFTGTKDAKTRVLVGQISRLEYIVTSTEYEALLLENNLIKQHSPKYNINLKDGKTYPVVRVTSEDFPRVFRTRRVVEDGSRYFGPFTDLPLLDRYLELIEEYFPLRKCHGVLKKRPQPCLYYHIQRCAGPCADKIDKESYEKIVDSIVALLNGDHDELRANLKARMEEAASLLKFEDASKFRDAIRGLEMIGLSQQVQDFDPESRDYIAWEHDEDRLSFVVFRMRGGKLLGSETFRTESFTSMQDNLEQFLLQFYEKETPPQQIFILPVPRDEREDQESVAEQHALFDQGIAFESFERWISETRKQECQIRTGTERKESAILAMARENARQDLSRWKTEQGDTEALRDLASVLKLEKLPLRIEGFDIAQLHGKHTVAAMVSFWKGIPDKNRYRIFGIRSLNGKIDDYESIREAVARRYTKVLNEELERPDLVLIDGGKGQLNAAVDVLRALGLDEIPVCSLAKDEEEVFVPGESESLRLPEGSPALRLLQAVRDESHRFGTTRNQKLRSKDLKMESLEAIPGIGPTRAKKLMQEFGSIKALREADAKLLHTRGKLPAAVAEELHKRLNKPSSPPEE